MEIPVASFFLSVYFNQISKFKWYSNEYFFYNSRICIVSKISLPNSKSLRLFSYVAFKGSIVLMLKFGYMIYIN